MECHRRAVYYVCDRLLTGLRVVTTSTTTTLSSPSLSSSLLTSRRSHGNSSSSPSSSSSCFGYRNVVRVSSPVVPSASRHVVALYLVWICMVVAVAAPDLPRSRSRSRFRLWTQRPVTPPPPQDTRVTTCHHSAPPRLSSSAPSRSSSSPAETVEGGGGRRMAVAFTLPSRAPRTRSTTRLSKTLEYSDVQLPETSIRRPQSRSQSDILHRPSAEIIAVSI